MIRVETNRLEKSAMDVSFVLRGCSVVLLVQSASWKVFNWMDGCRHTRWWTGCDGCEMQHVVETWSCLFAQAVCSCFRFGPALFMWSLQSSQTCLVHDISMGNIFLKWLLDLDLGFLSLMRNWGLGTTGKARRFARLFERENRLWKIGTVRIIWIWAELSKHVGARYPSSYLFAAWIHAPISYGRTHILGTDTIAGSHRFILDPVVLLQPNKPNLIHPKYVMVWRWVLKGEAVD